MTFSTEQLIAVLAAGASIITTMAGVVYRELKAQIADCKGENATLRAEAKDAVKAKDAEIVEWKRLLLESRGRETPR